jgi:hypothetical protein
MHLSCKKIRTISKWTELSLESRHLGVPSAVSKTISETLLFWRKLCIYLAPTLTLPLNRKKWYSTWPMSPRSSIGCVQNDFDAYGTFDVNRAPILCLQDDFWACGTQTMRLSCTDRNTTSKRKEERFHKTHVTQELHRVRPKWFSSLCYVQRKRCTNLASRLAISPNGPSFHLSLITSEYNRMCLTWFLSRWYVWLDSSSILHRH